MSKLIEQYNAAGKEMSDAFDAYQNASDEERDAAKERFNAASAEFQRVKENKDASDIVSQFKAVPVSDPTKLDMESGQIRSYSLIRAINAQLRAKNGEADAWKGAEFERECSEEIAKRSGRDPQGFYVPTDIQMERRDLSGITKTSGAELVSTDLLTGSYIDLLRNKMVCQNAGATFLSGLVGNVAIPKMTNGATFSWVATDGTATESDQTFAQVTMTPKTGRAMTTIGRSLLKQSSMDVETLVRNDLATATALGIDLAALNGTGANNQPNGLAKTSGISSVIGGTNGAAPSHGNIIDLETAVSAANADLGNLAYVTNAKVRGKLKQTPIQSGDSKMVWGDDGTLNGYAAFVSNQVPSNLTKGTASTCSQIWFGNWADLIIGQWGMMDVVVDPYTSGASGAVRIIVLQDIDIAVRHAESFALMADALA